MKTGAELIVEERKRQIDQEGWTDEHDDQYIDNELAMAAVCYAVPEEQRDYSFSGLEIPVEWPFNKSMWKPSPNVDDLEAGNNFDERVRELTKAGALIAAEIDRLLRCKASLMLILLATLFSSCKKDDVKPVKPVEKAILVDSVGLPIGPLYKHKKGF